LPAPKAMKSTPRTEPSSFAAPPTANQLGTFGGVFTPSILTILGVIMFMRAGFVTGEAGVAGALLILLLAKAITFLTSLSISAVSTNTPVAGGGAYFLISRVLGPASGGAIGLALYLAQGISVPFYILGFTEALVRTFPQYAPWYQLIAGGIALILFAIAFIGAGWATRTQYVIMAVLGVSVLAFLGGAALHFQSARFVENWRGMAAKPGGHFWMLFAIYFPAATGIMAGVNMSGDLKDPARSIPRGTLAAIGVGLGIYLLQILLVGGAQTRDQLVGASYETLCEQALFGLGACVAAGVFAATLSSALGSFLGAPRVLQAVGRDRVIPALQWFAKGSVRGDEPRRALGVTLMITLGVIVLAGSGQEGQAFNILAAIVTMFFLYTYGMVNVAAFVESSSGNPSFRPRFRYFHWTTALLGGAGCAGAAFLIDPLAAALAALVVILVYLLLRRRVLEVGFGDARWGFFYARVRNNLLNLARTPTDAKNWRPTILVLSGNPDTRRSLATYAIWVGSGRGVVTLADILTGDVKNLANRRPAALERLQRFLDENSLTAFPEVVIAQDFDEGLITLLQCHSIGPLKPNLVLFGWTSDPERLLLMARHLQAAKLLGMSMALLRDRGLPAPRQARRIDIWWRGRKNGSLMIVLAHLLKLNWEWAQAEVRLLRVIEDEAGRKPATEALDQLVDTARIEAKAQVIVSQKPFSEVLHRHSEDASVVFLGFNVADEGEAETAEILAHFETMTEGLPTTMLVCSSGAADLLA